MKKRPAATPVSASKQIDAIYADSPDWQAKMLTRIRRLIREADPKVVEEVKWKKPSNPAGVPVFSHDGILLIAQAHQHHVRVTFSMGAALDDPKGVFNSGLTGNAFRAIVLHEGDKLDEAAFKSLVRAAVRLNVAEAAG